jgi:hypothetical protein
MNKNLKYPIILLLFLPIFSIYSDRTSVTPASDKPDACQTDFDPNSTLVTFYGDSLGELVSLPLYGYFGWEWYLTTQEPRVRWDVQNLARTGSRTQQVYDLIC